MPRIKEVVADSTDSGTLRPDLPPEPATGNHFEPLFSPKFDAKISLPPGVDRNDAFAIWSLFMTPEQLAIIVTNTNKKGRARVPVASLSKQQTAVPGVFARVWVDITLDELYVYLGILFYMGCHPENDIPLYWNSQRGNAAHIDVWAAMPENRWKDINRSFSICDPDILIASEFERVGGLNYLFYYIIY